METASGGVRAHRRGPSTPTPTAPRIWPRSAIVGAHGITQGQIAAMTGIAQSTLSSYVRGKIHAEFASTFENLAEAATRLNSK